jgi:hypothetical protein
MEQAAGSETGHGLTLTISATGGTAPRRVYGSGRTSRCGSYVAGRWIPPILGARCPPLQVLPDQELSQNDGLLDARRGRQAVILVRHGTLHPQIFITGQGKVPRSSSLRDVTREIATNFPARFRRATVWQRGASVPRELPPSRSLATRNEIRLCIECASTAVTPALSAAKGRYAGTAVVIARVRSTRSNPVGAGGIASALRRLAMTRTAVYRLPPYRLTGLPPAPCDRRRPTPNRRELHGQWQSRNSAGGDTMVID